jgi:transaldolase
MIPSSSLTPLQQMTSTTPTALWNDSCSVKELEYSLAQGAVGATCNPVIVVEVLKKEMSQWKPRIEALIREMPEASEGEIAWRVVEEMSITGARVLKPVFDREKGKNGRLSIQTDPALYRSTPAILAQAMRFHGLAPNMIVKIPVTRAGVAAIEEATYRGVSINATVSFSLPQCLAVAEAVERGLKRRERERLDIASMGPVCTIMVGRLDDWLKVVADKKDITADPGTLDWAGVAVFKRAYRIFKEKGYRLRLLSAAFRNHLHWSQFIGGDVVISPPHRWQVRYNASDVPIRDHMSTPVDPKIVDELERKFSDFRRAYEPDGLKVEEFDDFPPTRRTLRQFIGGTLELMGMIREMMIPDPDKE